MALCFPSIDTHYEPAHCFLAVLMRDTAGPILRVGGQLSSMNLMGDGVVCKTALSTQFANQRPLLMATTCVDGITRS